MAPIDYIWAQGSNSDPWAIGPAIMPEYRGATPHTAALRLDYEGDQIRPPDSKRYKLWPFFHKQVVIGIPAVIPSASVGANPKDTSVGPYGGTFNPPANAPKLRATVPTIGW